MTSAPGTSTGAVPLLLGALEVKFEEGVPLARLHDTRYRRARAVSSHGRKTLAELEEAAVRLDEREVAVAVVGLGPNLLVADDGVDRARAPARRRTRVAAVDASDRRRRRCAERCRPAPGARGGPRGLRVRLRDSRGRPAAACWMNAGAYGGDFAQVLERALVVSAAGSRWLTPSQLGLAYRSSDLKHGQVVARVELRLVPRPQARSRRRRPSSRRGEKPRSRRTSGHSGASSRTPSTS